MVKKFKVIIVGEPSTGKTALLRRCADDKFTGYDPSVGVDMIAKTFHVSGEEVKLLFWDTTGQEKFDCITKSFYRRADAAIVMYDITRKPTFDKVTKWVDNIRANCKDQKVRMFLVGGKADLDAKREITVEKGKSFAKQHGLIFAETSAKTGQNVNQLFERIAKKLIGVVEDANKIKERQQDTERGPVHITVNIASSPIKVYQSKCC